jgi:regulator of ribonuclease activity A
MNWTTADLWDDYGNKCKVVEPLFLDFGGKTKFWGAISTVKLHEDNSLVRSALEEEGSGKVLVVDGGGSTRCALLGDRLAELGKANGWEGVIVHGAVRDTVVLKTIDFAVKALCANPRKSEKRQEGRRDVTVHFGGVEFRPGEFLYADEDGILLSPNLLLRDSK